MKKIIGILKILLICIFPFSLINVAESQVTVSIPCDKDNTIYSTYTESSNALGNILLAGRIGSDGGFTIGRSLLHFNLSNIPAGSTINSATLTLQINKNRSDGFSLHKLAVNWGEGTSTGGKQGSAATEGDATWIYAFYPNTKWTTEGGDFDTAASAVTDYLFSGPLAITNLKADVQTWVRNSSSNFGWMLKGTNDNTPNTAKLIYSRNNSDSTLRPVLSVTYTCNGSTFYADKDGDGYGDLSARRFAADCIAPAGYVYDSTDCNDNNAAMHPGACDASNGNGVDENCDGIVDDGFGAAIYYTDADGDGYGTGIGTSLCSNPGAGYSLNNIDCDDSNPAINVTISETGGDGIDNNCNGIQDENNALDFDGADDYISLPDINPISSGIAGQYTVEAWIMLRSYSESRIYGDERRYNQGIVMGINDSGYIETFHPYVDGGVSTYRVPLNTWTHVAFVQDSANLKLYVNGAFIQNLLSAPYLHVETNEREYIGAYKDDVRSSEFFNGRLDEVRIWNIARTAVQIKSNMNLSICGSTSGLVANFPFNEGVAGGTNTAIVTADDITPNNNNGTLSGFALTGDSSSNWLAGAPALRDSTTFYQDADGDSFGNVRMTIYAPACDPPAGYVWDSTDCNDANASVHPGACDASNGNGIDDNCDGVIDDGFGATTYYIDADGDGYGAGVGTSLCRNPGAGYSTNNSDCNDNNAAIHPLACDPRNGNNVDDNCDGAIDNGFGDPKPYGMTYQGGSNDLGVIFSYDPSSSTYANLKNFNDTNGAHPFGSMVQASDRKLYGMTYQGGSNGGGVIFSFDPASSTYTKLKDLDGGPQGSLIQASDGKLYGMTSYGGSGGYGVIFSFDLSSSTYTKLSDFDGTNGAYPYGSLLQASDGKLYGMTSGGGNNSAGVIFSYDPSDSTYTKRKDFDDTDGAAPYGSLMQASDGKLYGMTYYGGSTDVGVIFSFDPSSSTYTKVKDFNSNDASGAHPYGDLVESNDRKLYGLTSEGGSSGSGVIFSYDPSSSTYTKLHNFNDSSGSYPQGSLIAAIDGKLYGVTNSGGSSGSGVVFSYDPSSSTYKKLKDFDYTNGASPIFSSLTQARGCIDENKGLSVSLTTPINNATYLAPAAHIKLTATVSGVNNTISKVEFYKGKTLLHTETVAPYGFVWRNVPLGNYTLTAKATDNSGLVTTSEAVNISVVPNKPPAVSIIAPANNEHYAAPAYIHFEAAASDTDGTIKRVEFYNGSTLLRIEYKYPYTYVWKGVPVGTYTITAVATDNWGAQTTSDPIIVKVIPKKEAIVSNRQSVNNKSNLTTAAGLEIHPNPATNTLNIYIKGWQQNRGVTISVISASGIVLKNILSNSSTQTIQLDVSSLVRGVYTLKVMSGDRVMLRKFVKL